MLNSMYRWGLVDTLDTHANMKVLGLTPLFGNRRGFMLPQLKTKTSTTKQRVSDVLVSFVAFICTWKKLKNCLVQKSKSGPPRPIFCRKGGHISGVQPLLSILQNPCKGRGPVIIKQLQLTQEGCENAKIETTEGSGSSHYSYYFCPLKSAVSKLVAMNLIIEIQTRLFQISMI